MSYLPQADLILVLVDGEITESGSYQELLNRKGAFADFIRTFASSERKECSVQRGRSNTVFFYLVQNLCYVKQHYFTFVCP